MKKTEQLQRNNGTHMCNESNKREIKGAEEIFEAITADCFLNLMETINLYIIRKLNKFQICKHKEPKTVWFGG